MIGCDFHYRDKIPVGILGATGSVGQRFVQLLSRHPWFEVKWLGASENSAGKPYAEAAQWQFSEEVAAEIGQMTVEKCQPGAPCSIVFSGLDSSVAGEVETRFAEKGYFVISNSRNHRMDPDVPLLIPEVNSSHLALLQHQHLRKGKIITNPNCSVIGMAMALKPLEDAFGLEAVHVVTLQAISGAGLRGRKEMDIDDNVIPFIRNEEQKIESEIHKILGTFSGNKIAFHNFPVSAHCNRVPVSDGHLLCISVKLKKRAEKDAIVSAWTCYQSEAQSLRLPSAPKQPLHYCEEEASPQTKHERDRERGMAVTIGRLRKCPILDYKFVALSHNTIRGAAGCAILNAELLVKKGFIYW